MNLPIGAERATTLATAFLALAMAATMGGDIASRQAAASARAAAASAPARPSGPFLCRPGRIPVVTCQQAPAPPAAQTAPRTTTSGPVTAGR